MAKSKSFASETGMTGIGRVSYPYLLKPQTDKKGNETYQVTLIFDPQVPEEAKAIKDLQKVVDKVGTEAYGDDWENDPDSFSNPLKFGNPKSSKTAEEYKGKYYIAFKKRADKGPPGVIDGEKKPVTFSDDLYAGCYGRLTFFIHEFSVEGNTGVTCKLNNFQKVRDGKPIAGHKRSAEEEFDEIESDGDVDIFS